MPRTVRPLSGVLKVIGILLLVSFIVFAICARGRPRSEWRGVPPVHQHK